MVKGGVGLGLWLRLEFGFGFGFSIIRRTCDRIRVGGATRGIKH